MFSVYLLSSYFYLKLCNKHLHTLAGRHQLAKYRYRRHANKTAYPNGADNAIGMIERLPCARSKRMTDGIVAFAGYGDERP